MNAKLLLDIVLLIAGFFLLAKGSDWFVEGSAGVASKLRIPQIIVGLTIVAMGTSLPEASVSIVSALKGSADISIGNVLGSNIMNVLLILGVTATIARVPVEKATIKNDIPFMLAMTVLLMILSLTGSSIYLPEGVLLWICFVLYLTFLVKQALKARKNNPSAQNSPSEGEFSSNESISMGDKPLHILIFYIIAGSLVIIGGSNISVDSATDIARIFGISERVIGLTVIAFGTSLPELFTSATAALKGDTGIAIGNIVGSNIFNILFVLGTSALIVPIPFSQAFMPDMIIAIASVVLLWVLCIWKKGLVRFSGLIMLVFYAAYFTYLLTQ